MRNIKIVLCMALGCISNLIVNAQEINFTELPGAATPGFGELVYDSNSDRLFIATGANEIRVIDQTGSLDSAFGGDGIIGNDVGEVTLLDAEYIAIFGNLILINDQETGQIFVVNSNTGALDLSLATDGIIGNDIAEPDFTGLTIHDIEVIDDQLYIATNSNVIKYALDGTDNNSIFSNFPAQTLTTGPINNSGSCSTNAINSNQLLYAIAVNELNGFQGNIACLDNNGGSQIIAQTNDVSLTDLVFSTPTGDSCGSLAQFSGGDILYIASRRFDTELRCVGADGSSATTNDIAIGASTGITTADNKIFIREVGAVGSIYVSETLNQVPTVASQNLNLDENTPVLSIVTTVIGTDPDAGTIFSNWTIFSGNTSVDGDSDLPFSINPLTGEITVNDVGDIDRELISEFTLSVTVSDGIATSSPAIVTINLNDLNEFIPQIDPLPVLTITQNPPNLQVIATATATDDDATSVLQNWMIISGNNSVDGDSDSPFAIDTSTGVISVNDTDDLSLDLATDFTLMITVSDGTTTSTAVAFTIILDINDAPSFTAGADQFLPAGSVGLQTIPAWATNITAGPNEANQAVQFIANSLSDPDAIVGDLIISPSGALAYLLTGNTGLARFEIILMDDGGTNNGGIDQSNPVELIISNQNGVEIVVSNTDGQLTAENGEQLDYTITVGNNGPQDALGVAVTDIFPAELINISWVCVANLGASCSASGAGNINELVDLPVGSNMTFSVNTTVSVISGPISTTVDALPAVLGDEILPDNNTSTDTTFIGDLIFKDSFE